MIKRTIMLLLLVISASAIAFVHRDAKAKSTAQDKKPSINVYYHGDNYPAKFKRLKRMNVTAEGPIDNGNINKLLVGELERKAANYGADAIVDTWCYKLPQKTGFRMNCRATAVRIKQDDLLNNKKETDNVIN